MRRKVHIRPAYNLRHSKPNYGQGCLEFDFLVGDSDSVLVFTISTGWYIAELKALQIGSSGSFRSGLSSQYCRLVYHEVATLSNSVDSDPQESCGWLNGDPCQSHEPFGCTGKPIGDLFFVLLEKGLPSLFEAMEIIWKEERNQI